MIMYRERWNLDVLQTLTTQLAFVDSYIRCVHAEQVKDAAAHALLGDLSWQKGRTVLKRRKDRGDHSVHTSPRYHRLLHHRQTRKAEEWGLRE
jgi:hypothetical protein